MDIDLERCLPKVTEDSERSVPPSDTVIRALDSFRASGVEIDFNIQSYDSIFWTSHPAVRFVNGRPEFYENIRMAGKGPTEEQCKASSIMELAERWSLMKNNAFKRDYYDCYELRTGKIFKMKPILELRNTMCLASGNNYEEAILHCLHELIETRTPITSLWQPCKIVDVTKLLPGLPPWAADTVAIVKMPTEKPPFYKFTAVQYPFNREFDDVRNIIIKKEGDRIVFSPRDRDPKKHSPNSGGAAGINPGKAAFRAMNEIFQFQNPVADFRNGKKKKPPAHIQLADEEEFTNYETDSITGDIRFILDNFDSDVFIGVIDLTDPDLDIPVVKLISDYNPSYSLVSPETMNVFFDF